jgi:2-haloacid dehalogenase
LTAAAAAVGVLAGPAGIAATPEQPIRAVAFDGLAVLDPRPALALAKRLHPKVADAFVNLFQSRLFEYQWLRALGGHYKDFLSIVDDAHIFAAAQTGDEASEEARKLLREAFLDLKAWPDSSETLKALKMKGFSLGFLSNMTAGMLKAGLANSGLMDVFDHVLSTDAIRSYKPDSRAYQLGVDGFGLPKEQIAFVAFAGWDAAGAAWFGYPTIWVNRLGSTPEQLDGEKITIGRGLADLGDWIAERSEINRARSRLGHRPI